MKARDYLDLKKPLVINRQAKLNKAEMIMYRQMEKDAVLEIEDKDITAFNAAAVTNKLLQLANGAVYRRQRYYRNTQREA